MYLKVNIQKPKISPTLYSIHTHFFKVYASDQNVITSVQTTAENISAIIFYYMKFILMKMSCQHKTDY
jgi:hypothetical protein